MKSFVQTIIGAILVSLLFLSCSGGVEVTREMIADANVDIDEENMPEYKKWAMEETSSGVRFVELRRGEGARPKKGENAVVQYRLWLKNGRLIDSTSQYIKKSFEFQVGMGRVIEGWDEIVQLMNVGSRFLVEIPPKLGYGKNEVGPIPKNSKLVFAIDLIEIK